MGTLPMSLLVDHDAANDGNLITLSWNAPDAQSCTASGGLVGDGWAGSRPATGSVQLTEAAGGRVNYTLSCTGDDRVGRAKTSVDWIFIAPDTGLYGPTAPVMVGGIAYLSWSANVTSCVASGGVAGDGWAGPKPNSGSMSIAATQIGIATYILTCGTAPRMAVTQISVNVVAPSVTLFVDATQLRVGSYINLHWVGGGEGGTCSSVGGSQSDGWTNGYSLVNSSGSAILIETGRR